MRHKISLHYQDEKSWKSKTQNLRKLETKNLEEKSRREILSTGLRYEISRDEKSCKEWDEKSHGYETKNLVWIRKMMNLTIN